MYNFCNFNNTIKNLKTHFYRNLSNLDVYKYVNEMTMHV